MPRGLRIVFTVLATVTALYAIVTVWRQNERAAGLDFYIYFVAGQIAGRADIENIYSAEVQERVGDEYFERAQRSPSELRKYDAQRRRRLDLVSSPFLFSTLRWVSVDYERALTQYHAFVLFCFVAGVLLFCRAAGVSWAGALFLLAGLLLWYRGFEADLRVGNVNSMQLLALAIAVSVPRLRWFVFGALLLFKPNVMFVPLLFVVARLARREYRAMLFDLAAGAGGALVAFVVASVTYGSARVWLQWVSAANAFYHRLPTRMERNVTPALSLFHDYGEWVSYVLAAILIGIACLAIWLGGRASSPRESGILPDAAGRRAGSPPDAGRMPALLTGLGMLIYLLSANVVWLHYMVLVIPIAIAVMRTRASMIIAIVALLLIAEEPFEWIAKRAAAPIEAWLIAPAMIALFVCGVVALQRNPSTARR